MAASITGSVSVNHHHAAPPAWSAHRQLVRRIAPADLVGRQQELDDLAAFCTAAHTDQYRWWRAPAWAGKSALMSWFALHPPAGVRLVSFFITARWAGQSDRIAFADVLIPQLGELLGEPVPQHLTDATRDMLLLELLDRAADACRARGERLVLLVDGLDEDRGVTTGPDAHSIAALLPDQPRAGRRVIVAGRPNPPIPTDVPGDHPLRDPAIVRELATSPAAAVVKRDMLRELDRLLQGAPAEQDLLGVLAAAGGGLSARDLAEITGRQEWEIQESLTAVAGRSFTSRPSAWHFRDEPEVFVLGHEELQNTAVERIGTARIAEHRRRLHDWADGYRRQGWPRRTPEYLLRGYFRLLQSTADLARMMDCATDPARQDLMLDVTGGDIAATAEITTTMDAILTTGEPDLLAMTELARQRDRLTDRNTEIPGELPALWESLGHPARADALAHSLANLSTRGRALTTMIAVAVDQGDHDRARALADQATAMAATAPQYVREAVLEGITAAMGTRRDTDRAAGPAAAVPAHIAAAIKRYQVAWASSRAGELVAYAGDLDDAESLARSVTDPYRRVEAMVRLAKVMIAQGNTDRARTVARRAEAAARNDPDPGTRARGLTTVAVLLAMCGEPERAHGLVASVPDPQVRAWSMHRLVRTVAACGDPQRAETMAGSIANPYLQAWALAEVATVLFRSGSGGHAATVVERVETVVRRITSPAARNWILRRVATAPARTGRAGHRSSSEFDLSETVNRWRERPYQQTHAMMQLVTSAAETGDVERMGILADRALTMARSLESPSWAAVLLTRMAATVGAGGDPVRAVALADDIGVLARSIVDPRKQAGAWTSLLTAVTATGRLEMCLALADRAAQHVDRVPADRRDFALTELARAVAAAGDFRRAATMATAISDPRQAAEVTRISTDATEQRRALLVLATAAARSRDYRRARQITEALGDRGWRDRALSRLVAAAHANRDRDEARSFLEDVADVDEQVDRCSALARSAAAEGDDESAAYWADCIPAVERKSWMLQDLAKTATARGHHDRALDLVRRMPDRDRQTRALADLATAAAARGDYDQAVRLNQALPDPDEQVRALTRLATVAAVRGDYDRAMQLNRSVPADRREWALIDMARAAAARGDHGQAMVFVDAIASPYHRDGALGRLATLAAGKDDPHRADALIDAITDGFTRTMTLSTLIHLAVDRGDHHRAEALGERLDETPEALRARPAESNSRAARALLAAVAGDHVRATGLVDSIASPADRGEALTQLAKLAARRGDHSRADALVDQVAVPGLQAGARTTLLRIAVARGDYHRIHSATGWFGNTSSRDHTLENLARQTSIAHDNAGAMALCRAIGDPRHRERVVAVLLGDAATEDLDRAVERADAITDPTARDTVLASLATVAARRGDHRRVAALTAAITRPRWALNQLAKLAVAEDDHEWLHALIDGITDPKLRIEALTDLAEALADHGDRAGAAQIIDTLADRDQQRAWRRLATIAARNGHPDQALALCRAITDLRERTTTLIELARSPDTRPADARRFLGWALRWGPWREPLQAMATVQPDVVLRLAGRLLRADGDVAGRPAVGCPDGPRHDPAMAFRTAVRS